MKVHDITNIQAVLNRYKGLSRPSHFVAMITPPASLVNEGVVRDLMFLCNATNLPGINFATELTRHKGYGIEEQRPSGVDFTDLSMSFFCDSSGAVRKFFQKWAQKQFNFDANTSRQTSGGTGNESFGYPADVWGTINISTYNSASEVIETTTYDKAFIRNMGEIQLAWDQNDQIVTLPMQFAYRSWSTETTSTNALAHNPASDTSDSQRREALSVLTLPQNSFSAADVVNRFAADFT